MVFFFGGGFMANRDVAWLIKGMSFMSLDVRS